MYSFPTYLRKFMFANIKTFAIFLIRKTLDTIYNGKYKQIWVSVWTPGHIKQVWQSQTLPWWPPESKNSETFIDSFQWYWWLKNSAIWLDESILANIMWIRIFQSMYMYFYFTIISDTLYDEILRKSPTTQF